MPTTDVGVKQRRNQRREARGVMVGVGKHTCGLEHACESRCHAQRERRVLLPNGQGVYAATPTPRRSWRRWACTQAWTRDRSRADDTREFPVELLRPSIGELRQNFLYSFSRRSIQFMTQIGRRKE